MTPLVALPAAETRLTADEVRVEWADGTATTRRDVAADQVLTVTP